MPIDEKEIEEEATERRKARRGLEKRIVRFLQECLLYGEPYCTTKEITEDFKKAEFYFEETTFPFEETWLHAFLRKKSSVKMVRHKGKKYYRYRYGWWAKICSMFRN